MNKRAALYKLKFYRDVVRFPSAEFAALSFFQRWKMKQITRKGLPVCTSTGVRHYWKITFWWNEQYDVMSGALLSRNCTDISIKCINTGYEYNLCTGELCDVNNNIKHPHNIVWTVGEALKHYAKEK